jgi:microcystin-dependent protein
MADPFVGQLALVPYDFAPKGCHFVTDKCYRSVKMRHYFRSLAQRSAEMAKSRSHYPISGGGCRSHPDKARVLKTTTLARPVDRSTSLWPSPSCRQHTHALNVRGSKSDKGTPVGNLLAGGSVYSSHPANGTAALAAIGNAGSGQAHENRPPYLALNWIIALVGVFPARS